MKVWRIQCFKEKVSSDLGAMFSKDLVLAIREIIKDSDFINEVSASINQVSTQVFNDLTSGGETSSFDFGKEFSQKFIQFVGGATDGVDFAGAVGSHSGQHLNKFIVKLIKDVRIDRIVSGFMKEASGALKEGVKDLDIQGNMKNVASELDSGMDSIQDVARSHINALVSNATWDAAPWIALTGALIVGVPLLITYIYKRAVHNIGRPPLAREQHKAGEFRAL